MRSPLTHVPFEEPRSVTHQAAGNFSRTAWRGLAVGSSSSATSFSDALPTVVRSASSENRQLPAPDITSIWGCTDQAYDELATAGDPRQGRSWGRHAFVPEDDVRVRRPPISSRHVPQARHTTRS